MSSINETVLWATVAERIGFFSKETAQQIPSIPGVYGWFIPLWMYRSEPVEFIDLVQAVVRAEEGQLNRELTARIEDRWENVDVRLLRSAKSGVTDQFQEDWRTVQSDPQCRAAFERALMEASILMPPLYVGKADDLRVRYEDHVTGRNPHSNTFFKRFSSVAESLHLSVEISDLLFVCIRASAPESADPEAARRINRLVEQTLMRLARPPFSLK